MSDRWFFRGLATMSMLVELACIYGGLAFGIDAYYLHPRVQNLSGQVTWDSIWLVWDYAQDVVTTLVFMWLIWRNGKTLLKVMKEL